MSNIPYQEVTQFDELGIKVTKSDIQQKIWKAANGSDNATGGWISPGRYTISYNTPDLHHNLKGTKDAFRMDNAAALNHALLVKVVRAQFNQLPFTNDNNEIPAGWDFDAVLPPIVRTTTETDIGSTSIDESDDGTSTSFSDFEVDDSTDDLAGYTVTVEEGDTLVVGFAFSGTGLPSTLERGSEGFTLHCASVPTYRAFPFGKTDGTYDTAVWQRFKDKMGEVVSNLSFDTDLVLDSDSQVYRNEVFSEIIEERCVDADEVANEPTLTPCDEYLSTTDNLGTRVDRVVRNIIPIDTRQNSLTDHNQFEYIIDILYNTAIKFESVSGVGFSRETREQLWDVFKFVCSVPSFGTGDWAQGVTKRRWAAHGVNSVSLKRNLSVMKLFAIAAIYDRMDDLGVTTYGTYNPTFEPLHNKATVCQTLKSSLPNIISYGKANQGTLGLRDVESTHATASYYRNTLGLGVNAGPTGITLSDMRAAREFRQGDMALKLWFAKLLRITLPTEVEQFLYIPQAGRAVKDCWGLTHSPFGHMCIPNGAGSCYSDDENSYMAAAMQWLWLTGEYDHTPMMQWYTRNPHFSNASFVGAYEGNDATDAQALYALASLNAVTVTTSYSAGETSIDLSWGAVTTDGHSSVEYEVYRLDNSLFGYAMSGDYGTTNLFQGSHPSFDKEYGVVKADYTLLTTTSDTSANAAILNGTGEYYFVVRAKAIKDGMTVYGKDSDILTVTVSDIQWSFGNTIGDDESGISWEFSTGVTHGTFADGSPWVLVPDGESDVTVTAVDPAPAGGRNGSVLNPVPDGNQSFDDRVENYDSTGAVTYPVTLVHHDSLMSTRSGTSYETDVLGHNSPNTFVRDMAILTCVTSIPEESLRPSPYGVPGSKITYDLSNMSLSNFQSLAVEASEDISLTGAGTRVQRARQLLARPWYYGIPRDEIMGARPYKNMPRTISDAQVVFNEAALLLHSSDSDKQDLMVGVAQHCVDMLGAMTATDAGYDVDDNISRAAGIIMRRLRGLTSGSDIPTATSTNLRRRLFWLNTYDDRYDLDTSLTGVTPVEVSNVTVSEGGTWHGDPIGWVRDLTLSQAVVEQLVFDRSRPSIPAELESIDSANPVNVRSDQEYKALDTRWAVAEAMNVLAFSGDTDALINAYGSPETLYFGYQTAARPISMDEGLIEGVPEYDDSQGYLREGELGSPFLTEMFRTHRDTIFPTRVRPNGDGLLRSLFIPKQVVPTVRRTLSEKYPSVVNNIITQPGVYEGFRANTVVKIRANDVTLRNFHIFDRKTLIHGVEAEQDYSGLVIEDGRIAGSYNAAIVGKNMTVRRCEIINSRGNGINIQGSSVVSENYIHQVGLAASGDFYGVVVNAGSGVEITGNYISTPSGTSGYRMKNCIRVRPRLGNVSGVTVSGNWFRGGTGPSVRIGAFPAAGNDISSITVTSNRFSQESGTSEAWSIAAPIAAELTTSGNYWWNPTSDNVGGDEITDPDYSGPGGPSIP